MDSSFRKRRIEDHPKFGRVAFRESIEERAARHKKAHPEGMPHKRISEPFRKRFDRQLMKGENIDHNKLQRKDIGRRVTVFLGNQYETGTLIGRMMRKLLIEFADGRSRYVESRRCSFHGPKHFGGKDEE